MSAQTSSNRPNATAKRDGADSSFGPRKRGRVHTIAAQGDCETKTPRLSTPISQPQCNNTSSYKARPETAVEEIPAPVPFNSLSKGCGFNRPRSDFWGTPVMLKQQLATHLGLRFSSFDPAPYPMPPNFDGLHNSWHHGIGETILVNPPFSDIGNWVAKMITEAGRGLNILALLPHQSERAWYQPLLMAAAKVVYIRGKVNYINLLTGISPRGGAPFPVFAVLLHKNNNKSPNTLSYSVLWPKQPKSGPVSSP